MEQGILQPNTQIKQVCSALRRVLEADATTTSEVVAANSPSRRIQAAEQTQVRQSTAADPTVTSDQPLESHSSTQLLSEFENNYLYYGLHPGADASQALCDFSEMSITPTDLQGLRNDPTPITTSPANSQRPSHESFDFAGFQIAQPQQIIPSIPVPNSDIPPLVEYAADPYIESIQEEENSFGFDFDFNTLSSSAQERSSVHHEPGRQTSDAAAHDRPEFNLYGDIGTDPFTSLFDAENEMSAATAPQKTKDDGNKALSQP